MIKLTVQGKMGKEFYLNPHIIESITVSGPDTIILLQSGKTLVVVEKVDLVCESIVNYRKQIGCFKNEE
jgi:flagellar protein FlbD